MNAITLTDVSHSFKHFSLGPLSLVIPRGYVTGIIGRNGSGKTTLLKSLTGVIPIQTGTIALFNEQTDQIREKLGFIYQELPNDASLTMTKLAKMNQAAYPTWDSTYYNDLCKTYSIPLKQKIKKMSTGTQRKCAIVLALAHHPELLVMDEPTAGLDPVIRHTFIQQLRDLLVVESKTVIFSTHITSDLENFADYIVLLDEGKVIFQLSTEEMKERFFIFKGNEHEFQLIQTTCYSYEEKEGLFHALIDWTKTEKKLPFTCSPASLEEIMYFLTEVKPL